MSLSVVAIKAAKGRAKAYKLGDIDRLYLLVTPAGGRLADELPPSRLAEDTGGILNIFASQRT